MLSSEIVIQSVLIIIVVSCDAIFLDKIFRKKWQLITTSKLTSTGMSFKIGKNFLYFYHMGYFLRDVIKLPSPFTNTSL